MNSRERVLRTLKHEVPDRVPLALGGSAYNINDIAYKNLIRYLGLSDDWKPFRNDGFKTSNYLDERVLSVLNIDFRYIYMPTPDLVKKDGGIFRNGWGQTIEKSGEFLHTSATLADATIKDIENYAWPNADDYKISPDVIEKAKQYKEAGYAVVARSVCSYGFMEQSEHLRGSEQFLVDMMIDESIAKCIVDHVGNTILNLTKVYLENVKDFIDIYELPGDDYGSQAGPLISVDLFNKYFKPWYKKIVELVKGMSPNVYVLAHSDGFITPFIPEFIDAGIDIIHPLQPNTGMDNTAIKKEYGKYVTFLGAVDIQSALPSGVEATKKEVKTRIKELGDGGGYIVAPANHIGPDVKPEAIVAMYKTAMEYGKY
ncbi:uroporphyrinogen decarboxylase family protein [Thermoanaerobacter wiegelii]|uniref:Uroporphyrinogen decarboxylase (URO-D) domain-containing protein n=1 Tax=Thermoanaerobacter wiegelii Rt8.B1 TaxID=697303 RepID=G2MTT6_9THEO|nr:uroporphyrinogen decarboxylase family protein [Thermoanaerobacter wiegelii]AEM79471.1 hypothetical protein Thewi_2118 [Thermoanaerobacter wiegelii Rt8.B1]